ncbi:GNAT family N-acetyltransferase [Salinibacterium sp. M195]|uniref:GNAT family N-acetyltransferase n=1 Tax=Salinibacterium sp. M195 TaxID=2583374 RepID=UPI001C63293A|nr:GNAT family N-acetyltransferase [Salinibacterium sp. M195]QYH36804.1 GNAT family N-acetyltransferase [Salinibacterium sp. M195]
MDDVVIVREDDPRCSALEANGYRIVGRSWGARLRLAEKPDLRRLEQVVTKVQATGIVVQELDASFANALFDLELANNADYPFTPATHQPLPVMSEVEGLWLHGQRVFGALDDGRLVGAVVGKVNDGVGDNDFASVLADYRGTGVGAAVAAASIIAFANDGVRTFAAGGAGANDASLGLVRSMGFTVEEQWRSYER